MMIHKINPSIDYNKWLNRLHTQLNDQTNQNLLWFPQLLSQQIRKYSKHKHTENYDYAPHGNRRLDVTYIL